MRLNINKVTKNLDGLLTVHNADISNLLALADAQSLPITGDLESTINVGGRLGSPVVEIKGSIPQGEIGGCDIHGVELEVNLHDKRIYFNKLRGFQGTEGEFNLSGLADKTGDLNFDFASHDLELKMFSGLAGLDTEVTGTANLNAKVTGTSKNPEVTGTLTSAGSIGGAAFDLLQANFDFKNWVFNLQEFFVQREVNDKLFKASAKGTIPIASNEQMNLDLMLDDADLSLLPVMNDYVAWAVGDMDGNIKITGTADSPQINGKIIVNDGTVKFKYVDSPIEHLNISTAFVGNRFDIEKFVGNVGDGNFNLSGGFNFANFVLNSYNFNLKADNLEVRSKFFEGPLNAEFSLREVNFFGYSLPKLAGHLDLDKCTISIPSIPDSDDPLPHIALDVSLNLGEKVHLYSSRLYDMFLTGSARFEGSTLHPKPSGSIQVKRGGTITYINSVFDIREGEAHFNQLESFFPSVRFFADTKLSNTKVFLYLNGSLNNMKLKLGSTPEMSETEIIQLLTLRENYEKGSQNIAAADLLAIGLQVSILGDLEDTVRRTLGLDQFRISSGTGSAFDKYDDESGKHEKDFNIFIGKYITDKVMLRYTQGITGNKISRYGFQYDINDNIGITVEHERGEFIFGLEARYKF